ncbi:AAC(3) family N-acetyltransferase, partial [Streptomyces sp. T-3]|nr:AAC(3) family N-acetyltransferase [Streptomyces sp. T-3]
MGTARTRPLTTDDLVRGWGATGVEEGMHLIVHSSLSRLGRIEGGAPAVVESLRTAVGEAGTVAVPAFTWQVADPDPEWAGV